MKRGITLAKMNLDLSLLFVHILLFIVNIYFEFQVYMYSNGRYMTKFQSLHHDDNDDNNTTKAIAIPQVFSQNSQAKNVPGRAQNIVGKGNNSGYHHFLHISTMFSKAFSLSIILKKNVDSGCKKFAHSKNSKKSQCFSSYFLV